MKEVNVLASRQACAHIGAALPAYVDGRVCRLVEFESAGADARRDIDVALISRDVTGASTKHVITEELEQFYEVLRTSSRLQWVHTHSAGLDRPIFPELQARGVAVTASSGVNATVVAHTALGGLLSLARRFHYFMRAQARHEWAPLIETALPRDLAGQTAVIVGWGPIAQYLAKLLGALGLQMIVVRHSAEPVPGVKAHVTYRDLHDVLPQADWLILACPLTDATHRLVDGRALSKMPKGGHLVNVARGEVMVESELIAALQCGSLAGAFLDVFEHEPLSPDSALWDMENVIVSPHSAGHSDGNYGRVIEMFIDKLRSWRSASCVA